MLLIAQTLSAQDFDPLHFIILSLVTNGKISPRAVIRFTDLMFPIHNLFRRMSSLDENAISTNFAWVQSVQTLIIGRLIVVFLLLITTWVWYSGRLELSFDRFP